MKVHLIEGPENAGKSSLIYAQYRRIMNTNQYKLVENHSPQSLDDFIYLIQHTETEKCILFNSATDTFPCIHRMEQFYNTFKRVYNIVTVVSSNRDINSHAGKHKRVRNFANNIITYSSDLIITDLTKLHNNI
ncbi:hypothetical protein [Bacteroides sp. 224]|uniref:hypothetical protein n=1 Tax=Bacteroides sp. 224 TaxID=2302936 RepID=UPI0013D365B7|nr:hypothetical protein [Bacteroides sp. 224]NDV66512.1 hypothetical protein [Bacteroides sp. 224]